MPEEGDSVTWKESVGEFKRKLLTAALTEHHGNRSAAAHALGLERTYLLALMRQLGVSVPRSPSATGPKGRKP